MLLCLCWINFALLYFGISCCTGRGTLGESLSKIFMLMCPLSSNTTTYKFVEPLHISIYFSPFLSNSLLLISRSFAMSEDQHGHLEEKDDLLRRSKMRNKMRTEEKDRAIEL